LFVKQQGYQQSKETMDYTVRIRISEKAWERKYSRSYSLIVLNGKGIETYDFHKLTSDDKQKLNFYEKFPLTKSVVSY
jgi:hypothetical protein